MKINLIRKEIIKELQTLERLRCAPFDLPPDVVPVSS